MATHVFVRCGNNDNSLKYYMDTNAFKQFEGFPQYAAKYVFKEIIRGFAEKYRSRKGKHG
jgi:hypothetical protein